MDEIVDWMMMIMMFIDEKIWCFEIGFGEWKKMLLIGFVLLMNEWFMNKLVKPGEIERLGREKDILEKGNDLWCVLNKWICVFVNDWWKMWMWMKFMVDMCLCDVWKYWKLCETREGQGTEIWRREIERIDLFFLREGGKEILRNFRNLEKEFNRKTMFE